MDILLKITEELGVKKWQVEAAVKLLDEGCTVPFISRYRKEATGALNDEQMRNLEERLGYLRNLEDKKTSVLSSIEEQGKLTDELKAAIMAAETLVVVEDLYRPYKQKKKTRAIMAKEKGLEPLADYILTGEATEPVETEAAKYISEEMGVKDAAAAIAGASDIIAERVSDEAQYRGYIRTLTYEEGILTSKVKEKSQDAVFEMYYDYSEPLTKVAGHRVLAINRGEDQKVLTIKIEAPVDRILGYLNKQVIINDNEYTTPVIETAIADSYSRLIAPAIERELRNELTEKAQDGAINVFGKNLQQLLMQPPIAGRVVLGWDPAFRTGCKLAVVDETGRVLDTKVIYPTEPQKKVKEAKEEVTKLVKKYGVSLISVGNGTASRESEQVIVELIKEIDVPLQYVIVNEAGASVYSASKLATEEFPNFDVGQRSAASIARRLQDPLAELVKIDPKSIGVGQYQHDMNQKKLGDSLTHVVEDSVNRVGVDLNTASAPLLEYISGISKPIAKNIVEYREKNGRFTSRKQLFKVDKLGPKAYEQCAGFLRIHDGDNPLDDTSVHPESYEATLKLLEKLSMTMDDVRALQKAAAAKPDNAAARHEKKKDKAPRNRINQNTAMGKALAAAMGNVMPEAEDTAQEVAKPAGSLINKVKNPKQLAQELGIGEITLMDILKELEKPSRDPRESMPAPVLRSDVLDMKDLKPGMVLKGTIRNVIDFGAFVDIGVHQDGLVHISQITDRFIKHPLDAVSVGDVVEVKVLEVDQARKRIALTMKL